MESATSALLSALARKFADVFGSGGLGGGSVELVSEAVKAGAGELPLERRGDLLVAAAEREEMSLERVEAHVPETDPLLARLAAMTPHPAD